MAVLERGFGLHEYEAPPGCRNVCANLPHSGDRNPAVDPNRVLGFFAYFFATCVASLPPGRGRRLPLPVHEGNGATVSELELLRFYVHDPDMQVNESGV